MFHVLQCYCDKVENLMEEGSSLCQGGHYEGVGIRERRRVLSEVYKNFCAKLDARRQQLKLCMEFHKLALEVSESIELYLTETELFYSNVTPRKLPLALEEGDFVGQFQTEANFP